MRSWYVTAQYNAILHAKKGKTSVTRWIYEGAEYTQRLSLAIFLQLYLDCSVLSNLDLINRDNIVSTNGQSGI